MADDYQIIQKKEKVNCIFQKKKKKKDFLECKQPENKIIKKIN